jgi:hypothetical protein
MFLIDIPSKAARAIRIVRRSCMRRHILHAFLIFFCISSPFCLQFSLFEVIEAIPM